jgi:hypothetical protein
MDTEYNFSPGELVHLREWHDESGWVTLHSTIFMVVSRVEDPTGEHTRNVIQVTGAGLNIETYAGYFVRVTEGDCLTTS